MYLAPFMNLRHKSATLKGVDSEERTARFVASDESIDRYGDIVVVNGWRTDNFEKNPQFLFGHQSNQLPIGRVDRTWKDGSRFMADVSFLPAGFDDFADKCFRMVKDGFLNAVSVGFQPIKQEPRYDDDGRYIGTKFLEQELLELSLVPIPANANAVQAAKAFGLTDIQREQMFLSADIGKAQRDQARGRIDLLRLSI